MTNKPSVKSQDSFRNPPASTGPATDQARNDRLCQAIADRVEVRFEGSGGKLALRAPRRRGEGSVGAGAGGGHRLFGGGIGGGEGLTGLEEEDGGDDDEDGDGGDGGSDSDRGLYGAGVSVGGGRGIGGDELGNQEKGKVRCSNSTNNEGTCIHKSRRPSPSLTRKSRLEFSE